MGLELMSFVNYVPFKICMTKAIECLDEEFETLRSHTLANCSKALEFPVENPAPAFISLHIARMKRSHKSSLEVISKSHFNNPILFDDSLTIDFNDYPICAWGYIPGKFTGKYKTIGVKTKTQHIRYALSISRNARTIRITIAYAAVTGEKRKNRIVCVL